jgi:hypothetical protein
VNGEEFVLQGDDAPQPGNNRRVVRLIGGLNHLQVRGQVEALGDGGPFPGDYDQGCGKSNFLSLIT